ncbi:MAG: EAL domain-containing protein [Desulfurispora sp.]|uniref:EAL domain-containing protein n=1 Tax=Desulfurispora sp. TaxID=3014275 RepID=UPI00404ACC0B
MRLSDWGRSTGYRVLVWPLLVLGAGLLIYYQASVTLVANVQDTLVDLARQGAYNVRAGINAELVILETLAGHEMFSSKEIPVGLRLTWLGKECERIGYLNMYLVDRLGQARDVYGNSQILHSSGIWEQALLQTQSGRNYVSAPFWQPEINRLVVLFAVPLWEDGQITGMLAALREGAFFCWITDRIKLGQRGNSFILDDKGVTIAHDQRDLVYRFDDIIKNSAQDPSLTSLAALAKRMTAGQTGAGEYVYHGERKYLGFAPVPGTSWSFATAAPREQIFARIDRVRNYFLLILLLGTVVLLWYNFRVLRLGRRLQEEQRLTAAAMNTAGIWHLLVDEQGRVVRANELACSRLSFLPGSHCAPLELAALLGPGEREKWLGTLEQLRQGHLVSELELEVRLPLEQTVFLWGQAWPLQQPGAVRFELILVDITPRVRYEQELAAAHAQLAAMYEELTASEEELRHQLDELRRVQGELETMEERYRLAIEGSRDVIWDWDVRTDQIYFSQRLREILGYDQVELPSTRQTWQQLLHPEDRERTLRLNQEHVEGKTPFYSAEYRLRTRDGQYRWFYARGRALYDGAGRFVRMAGSLTDITEKKLQEQVIKQMAYSDPLTGLPNRAALQEYLQRCLAEQAPGEQLAVIFLDVDNFKNINDTCGHSAGDQALVEISRRLLALNLPDAYMARLGGDEFVVLLSGLTGEVDLEGQAEKVCQGISGPIDIAAHTFYLSASVGVAVSPRDGCSAEDLLKKADTAMYRAKERGKNQVVYYQQAMGDRLAERLALEKDLRLALERDEFVLHYQPVLDVFTGQVYGYEALVRWQSPSRGFVSPASFIPLAEESGLIVQLGEVVLQKACAFANRLRQAGGGKIRVTVNISPRQLQRGDFVELVQKVLQRTGTTTAALGLEVTETALMESLDFYGEKLSRLRDMGIVVSLDDFGTGYSSLSYLRRLPVDVVKLDRSFLRGVNWAQHSREKDFLAAVIQLVQALGLPVVAEGVEDPAQLEYLRLSGCNYVQGYLLGRPVPEEEALLYQAAHLQQDGGDGGRHHRTAGSAAEK